MNGEGNNSHTSSHLTLPSSPPILEFAPDLLRTSRTSIQDHQISHGTINQYGKANLLVHYLQETSKWFEVWDSLRSFSSYVNQLMTVSPILQSAMITVASRNVDGLTRSTSPHTHSLYDSVTQILSSQEHPAQENEGSLVALLLMSLYHMISGDNEAAQLHLRKFAAHLQPHSWDIHHSRLPSIVFWAFAHIG